MIRVVVNIVSFWKLMQHQDSPNIFLKHSGTLKRNTIKRYYIAIHCNPSLYIINKAGLLPREVKGLEQTLRERGFNVDKMRAKCKPVCPFENEGCCMARLLSHQDDFANQISMLEACIMKAGHLCIFLPKFHCELNPIEMVCCLHLESTVTSLLCLAVLGLGKVLVPGGHQDHV